MHLSRSSSRIVMVTLGIRIMANLPDRKDDQRRVDHGGQSGHFYLAESGHFYLAITPVLRIMYIMVNGRKIGKEYRDGHVPSPEGPATCLLFVVSAMRSDNFVIHCCSRYFQAC